MSVPLHEHVHMTLHDLSPGFLQNQLQGGPLSYWPWGVRGKRRSGLEVRAAEGYRAVRKTKTGVTLVAEVVHLHTDKSRANNTGSRQHNRGGRAEDR